MLAYLVYGGSQRARHLYISCFLWFLFGTAVIEVPDGPKWADAAVVQSW
jgi:hypothetical protein